MSCWLMMRRITAAAVLCGTQLVAAQTPVAAIERVKISDNDLTCAQLHAEVAEMDGIAAQFKKAEAEAKSGGSEIATGAVADIFGRIIGIYGGVLGQIFGQVATQAAVRGVNEANKDAMLRTQEHARQAAARKEHLTMVFISRGCRASDITYNPPPSSPTPNPSVSGEPTAATINTDPAATTP